MKERIAGLLLLSAVPLRSCLHALFMAAGWGINAVVAESMLARPAPGSARDLAVAS